MQAQIEELLQTLQKDEETLKTNITAASGQLSYNRKVQEALKLMLAAPKSTANRKKK